MWTETISETLDYCFTIYNLFIILLLALLLKMQSNYMTNKKIGMQVVLH